MYDKKQHKKNHITKLKQSIQQHQLNLDDGINLIINKENTNTNNANTNNTNLNSASNKLNNKSKGKNKGRDKKTNFKTTKIKFIFYFIYTLAIMIAKYNDTCTIANFSVKNRIKAMPPTIVVNGCVFAIDKQTKA